MKRIVWTAISLLMAGLCPGQTATFRHFFAYGDQHLVDLARESGADRAAAIGREIPQNVQLRVPTHGEEFRLQIHSTYVDGSRPHMWTWFHDYHLSFDQSHWDSSSTRDPNEFLDDSSFRKVEPASFTLQTLSENFVNGQMQGSWDSPTQMIDLDENGEPDQSQYQANPTLLSGSANGTELTSLRNVGLYGSVSGRSPLFGIGGSRLALGETRHIIDVRWRSNLVNGEQYGSMGSETGLAIHVFPSRDSADWTSTTFYQSEFHYPGDPDWINIGARYNLIGAALVPEPTSIAALGLGLLLLRRKESGART
ncbi:MAG: PEP-CTERM sorting domain-containing protein [Chthonomonas sp.]|nr:PEP-CTERM sorting domain-containing protein [Chthonomonas sp.]